jgi:Na+-driven multidrug efflux pump
MVAMIIPSVGNLIMDYVFIHHLNWGMMGAAWATTGSYVLCLSYIVWFFLSKNSELKVKWEHFKLKLTILKEINALGFVTLSRQAVVSVTYLLLNNILFELGGESSVTTYAIIARMLMFALFPVLGVTQGFLPIAGYNYGAEHYQRVRESINKAIGYAAAVALVVFACIMLFSTEIVSVFTDNEEVLASTPSAMRWVFAAVPIIALQLIGSAYFQAIGKAVPALLLTLTRQGFFFIPLLLILPNYFGELGVWISFPLADLASTLVTGYFLNREIKNTLVQTETAS